MLSNTVSSCGESDALLEEVDTVETIKKNVGARASRIRERLGFRNREHFAEVLGVHSNTVGQLERGETWLSPEMVLLYREKFGVDPGEFLAEKPVVIHPSIEDAWEAVGKFIDESRRKPRSPDLPLVPDNIRDDVGKLVRLIAEHPDILGDVLSIATTRAIGRVDKTKRRARPDGG